MWMSITSYLYSDFYISLFMLSMWLYSISYFDCSHVSISSHTYMSVLSLLV